jgi:hypothetical protein
LSFLHPKKKTDAVKRKRTEILKVFIIGLLNEVES